MMTDYQKINPYFIRVKRKVSSFFFYYFIHLFLEIGDRRERERNIDWLPLAHLQLGTQTTTQACALSGNRTSSLLVHCATIAKVGFQFLRRKVAQASKVLQG